MRDKLTGQNVVLTDKDVDLVDRFNKGKFVDSSYDPYEVRPGGLLSDFRYSC